MIKVSVIGAGNWGKNLIKTFSQLGVLDSIVELNSSKREQMIHDHPDVTVSDNVDAILTSGIDAVAIATPVATHYALAEQFLRQG